MLNGIKGKLKSKFGYKNQLNMMEERLNLIADIGNALEMKFVESENSISYISRNVELINSRAASQLTAQDLLNAHRKSEIRLIGLLSRVNPSQKESAACPAPITVDFQRVLQEFQTLNPALFPVWFRLFENGARAYAETKIGNCSHNELESALLFRDIIDAFASGPVLDVGCGPYDVPSYLMSFPLDAVCGLEPLPLLTAPSYRVERGFGERIPWQDASFDTVVSGAALDHAFSLEVTLREIRRVLKPKGRFLLWIASVPGAEEFFEDRSQYEAFDEFHVFHFDQKWLDRRLDRYFKRKEKFVVTESPYEHVFYVMEKV